jgi:hypothetical protein
VDTRAGLDDVKRKFLALPGLELPDPSAVQPVASRYTDCAKKAYLNGNQRGPRQIWSLERLNTVVTEPEGSTSLIVQKPADTILSQLHPPHFQNLVH